MNTITFHKKGMSSSRRRFTRSRLRSLFNASPSSASYDISSLSTSQNATNTEINDNANPTPPKRKRKPLMPGFFCVNASGSPSSSASASARPSPWTQWRRRRWTVRPEDETPIPRIGALSVPTAEANRRSRPKTVKCLPVGSANLQLDLYKSPLCLCKVAKMEGKEVTPVAWRRFYIYIGGGYIRFFLASDFHYFNQNSSGSPLNTVDPFTLEGVSTNRCIILPMMGLRWSNQPFLPSDVPSWDILAPVPVTASFQRLHPSSEMVESESANNLPCCLFEHECNGGTEVTVIFPDTQTLRSTLELCQRHGGVCKETNPPSNTIALSSQSAKQHVGSALHRSRKSLPDSTIRRRIAAETVAGIKRTRDRSLERHGEQLQGTQRSTGVEDASKFRFFSSTAAPFFKGIANAISSARTAAPTTAINVDAALPTDPLSPEEVAHRVAAALGDPPDFGDLNQPGPVFGAPLEKQVPSPDYPNVPLVLHTTVFALEQHGLHHVGLYRAPGRQKEINRFMCLANLTSLDPHVMLSLPTWNDVRALTGVIKVFFRRLPESICDSNSWRSLACLIPANAEEVDQSSLVYALQAIRAKLNKIRSTSYLPLNASPTDHTTSVVSWRWRYATLDYLFTHLRRVVALEAANQVSFKCIAICFGPSLFNADNDLQNKFNVLLEVMLQHWPWLTADESGASIDDSGSLTVTRNTTVSEAEAYVKHYFDNGINLNDLSLCKMAPEDPMKALDVRTAVKGIFERAGVKVSASESLDRQADDSGEEEREESLLDVIMRSLPQPSDDHSNQNSSSDVDSSMILTSDINQRTNL